MRREAETYRKLENFRSFSELASATQEGIDFRRVVRPTASGIAVIAPHGGNLEPGASEIAALIAGQELSLYSFVSLKQEGDLSLRITSTRFDDPKCVEICAISDRVISVHGCPGEEKAVYVGGLDLDLGKEIIFSLRRAGIQSDIDHVYRGQSRDNICNKGRTRAGVQLEITQALRQELFLPFERVHSGESSRVLAMIQAIRSLLVGVAEPTVAQTAVSGTRRTGSLVAD